MEFEINMSEKFDLCSKPLGEQELLQDLFIDETEAYLDYLENVYDSLIYTVESIIDEQYEEMYSEFSRFIRNFMDYVSNAIVVCSSNISGLKNFQILPSINFIEMMSNMRKNRALWSSYIGTVEQILYKENLTIN